MKKDGSPVSGVSAKPDGSFTADELESNVTYTARFMSIDEELGKWVCQTPPSFTPKEGESTEVIIELEEGIPFSGKLTNPPDGLDWNQCFVTATVPGDRQYSAGSRVKDGGTWRMWLPKAGKYAVTYYAPGAASDGTTRERKGTEVTIQPGTPVTGFEIDMKAK